MSAWALATPIFASPDEPAHAIHAIGVAHGEWLGQKFRPGHGPPDPLPAQTPQPSRAGLAVEVPGVYRHWVGIGCLAFKPDAPASCLRFDAARADQPALTYTARYVPAYYLAVGSVSLITAGSAHQIYLMRLISAMLSAALIASAALTLLESAPGPWALTGLAVAVTPMTLFLAASINPNGLEIAAAIGVWVHGATIATGHISRGGDRVLTRLGIASIALALSRPTSLLWLGVIGVLLMFCAGRRTIIDLLHQRAAQLWTAALSVAIVLAFGWSVWAGAFNVSQTFVGSPVNPTTAQFARTTIGQGYELVRQMVGVFGWLDTPAPALTLLVWLFAVGALVGVAILVARPFLRTLGATVVLVVIVPVLIQGSYVHSLGFQWQGRYSLPLAVGVPILAGLGIEHARHHLPGDWRLALTIVTGLALAQFLGFAQALRRYTVGANGTIWFPWSSHWHPPVPTIVLLAGFAGLLCAASLLMLRVGGGPGARGATRPTPGSPPSV